MSMADCERPDSLEGWVAIKNNIFEETELFKLGFIVQWNVTECKFALTCHNRTLQRQRRKAELSPGDGELSWAGLFSVNDLKHIHQQFSCVADVLGACFPDLSVFDQGSIWDVLIPNRRGNPGDDVELPDFDTPCRKLEKYLSTAVDLCGRTIVLDTLFTQDDRDVEEYFENMQEFKKKSMQEEMSRSKDHLRQLLHTHSHTEAMVALVSIYEEEDEAYQELVTVATSFFHYLLQPFRDMRELACLYKLEILKSLEVEDLGPKRIAALEKEVEEWRIKGEDAVASIQDITVTYFAQTSKALAGMLKQMEEDKCRFGPAAWASAAPRLEKLRFLLAKETLQHMRATEMCLNRKKGNIREQLQNLPGHVQNQTAEGQHNHSVDQMEMQYYEIQLEIYNTKFEILKNEEQLLVAQIDSLRRQIKELKEEVLYYDVCEDPEELQSMVHTGLQQTNSPAVTQLRRRLQVLETKRGNICARRAYLRNKKDQCMEAHEQKQLSAEQSSIVFSQHHQIHLKREKKREEEQRRKEWVDQEREKTLSRLRSFREKRQGKYILKTPQSRSPPEASTPSQPLSIISLGPSPSSGKPPASVRPAPRSNKTGRKAQPREIPVQIYCTAPPQTNTTATSCPAVPPPPPPPPPPPLPPPPPPLPPAVPPPPVCDDTPSPLSEKQAPPFPAKTTLKQNIGTMDEVLASLQRGQSQLRKVSAAPPAENPRDSLMSAIRLGVTLKKVVPTRAELQSSRDNELERSIKAAIMRMKNVSADSDEEDEGDETRSIEWDS